jgi:hypothetical protein
MTVVDLQAHKEAKEAERFDPHAVETLDVLAMTIALVAYAAQGDQRTADLISAHAAAIRNQFDQEDPDDAG